MKRFINIFISLLMFSLTACSFFGTEELIEYGANGKVSLNLDISDFEAEKKSSRTILPAKETGSGISKYILDGTLAGSVETYNRTWTDYEDLKNDTLEMSIGTWTFTLSVYKKEGGVDKLFATGTVVKTLTITEVHTLSFNLSFAANTLEYGSLSVKVEVPYGAAKKADVSVYNYDASNNKNEVHNKTYTISGGGAGVKSSFNIEGNNLKKDYYFIQMDFHTDDSGTPTATRMQTVKIAGGQTSKATISYEDLNKKYVIKFHDMMKPGETCSLPYTELEYNSSTKITLPDSSSCTADHYEFDGWYENSSYTGSAITDWEAGARTGEVNLYAKWTPKTYTVNYYDFAGGQAAGKTYSGTAMPSSLTYGTTIPKPTYDTANGALSDGNEVVFAGWYTDKDCSAISKITEYDGSADLYAKWNYKYVYLDPTGTNGGSDANKGMVPTKPVKTVAEAKTYMKDNTSAEKVYLMSAINISSSTDTVNNPSGLTTPDYNNAVLQRHSSYTGVLLNVSAPTCTLENVTVDGGAIWDENGAAGVNRGIVSGTSSCGTLLVIYNAATSPVVTLTENVILQNNENINSQTGGGIRAYGTLIIKSKTCQIRTCASTGVDPTTGDGNSSGAIHLGPDSILEITGVVIGGLSKADSNYSKGVGAGIRGVECTGSSKIKMVIGTDLSAGDGSDILIANNVTDTFGAGIAIYPYNEVTIQKSTIIENSAAGGGGGMFIKEISAGNPLTTVTIKNTVISKNIASNGAGIYLNGILELAGKIDISENYRTDTTTENNIFVNNASSDLSIKLLSQLAPVSGKAKVATIDMTASKYPIVSYDASDSSTYVKILNEDSGAGYIASSYSLFEVERTEYKINDEGRVVLDDGTPSNYDGGIFYSEDNIIISLNKKKVYSASATDINITAFADKGLATETELTSAASATNWDIRIYSMGTDVSSNSTYFEITNTPIAHSVKVKSGIPAGTPLQVYVAFMYNAKLYGGTFNLEIE